MVTVLWFSYFFNCCKTDVQASLELASCHLNVIVPTFCSACGNDTAINRNSKKCCVVHDVSEEFSLLDGMLNGGGQVVDTCKKS